MAVFYFTMTGGASACLFLSEAENADALWYDALDVSDCVWIIPGTWSDE